MPFNTNYSVGGILDEVKKIPFVGEIGKISSLPQFTQPYNEMIMKEIPAISGSYELEFDLPKQEVEILAITLTCSGYDEGDYFNLWCNGRQWFKNWYTSEIKEGLYLGASTFAYKAPANSKIKIEFVNKNGTQKTIWIGFRMLVDGTQNANTSKEDKHDTN